MLPNKNSKVVVVQGNQLLSCHNTRGCSCQLQIKPLQKEAPSLPRPNTKSKRPAKRSHFASSQARWMIQLLAMSSLDANLPIHSQDEERALEGIISTLVSESHQFLRRVCSTTTKKSNPWLAESSSEYCENWAYLVCSQDQIHFSIHTHTLIAHEKLLNCLWPLVWVRVVDLFGLVIHGICWNW